MPPRKFFGLTRKGALQGDERSALRTLKFFYERFFSNAEIKSNLLLPRADHRRGVTTGFLCMASRHSLHQVPGGGSFADRRRTSRASQFTVLPRLPGRSRATLHATFKRVVDPKVPLTGDAVDGRAAERFQFDIMAICAALGKDRFFDALSRESPEIQRRMCIKGYPPR